MKLSTIYRRAAKLQEAKSYGFPCFAIAAVCDRSKNMGMVARTPAAKFTRVFSAGSQMLRSYNYIEARYHARVEGVHPQDYDVIALCFAAAIMEGK